MAAIESRGVFEQNRRQQELDAQYARGSTEKLKLAKRKKTGGRKRGTVNKRTMERIAQAERKIAEVRSGRVKLAVDHADELITYLRGLVGVLQPWNGDGSKREGKDEKLWFRVVELFQQFLNMRAPYQSPRLNAIAFVDKSQEPTSDVTLVEHRLRLERMGLAKPVIEGDYYDETAAGEGEEAA